MCCKTVFLREGRFLCVKTQNIMTVTDYMWDCGSYSVIQALDSTFCETTTVFLQAHKL